MKAKARHQKSVQAADEAIGHKIRALRLAKQMSQTDLANNIGVTFQQVQKYEKGTNRVSGARLLQIAGLLGVDISELMGTSGKMVQGGGELFVRLGQTREGHRLASAFVEIKSDSMRRAIVDLAEAANK